MPELSYYTLPTDAVYRINTNYKVFYADITEWVRGHKKEEECKHQDRVFKEGFWLCKDCHEC